MPRYLTDLVDETVIIVKIRAESEPTFKDWRKIFIKFKFSSILMPRYLTDLEG